MEGFLPGRPLLGRTSKVHGVRAMTLITGYGPASRPRSSGSPVRTMAPPRSTPDATTKASIASAEPDPAATRTPPAMRATRRPMSSTKSASRDRAASTPALNREPLYSSARTAAGTETSAPTLCAATSAARTDARRATGPWAKAETASASKISGRAAIGAGTEPPSTRRWDRQSRRALQASDQAPPPGGAFRPLR